MNKSVDTIILGLVTLMIFSHCAITKNLSLEEDITDGRLDEYSKIEAAFILSGVTNSDTLQVYLDWYNQLLEKIESFSYNYDDAVGSARTVFMYLHSAWLKTYAKESTTLADIVRNKEYNCVAATILYNIICEDLDWPCEAFETPTHVYTIFNNFDRNVIVENTSSMGFNILKNLKSYSKYLAQYYPQSEVLRIGLDRLYYHENSKGRVITNTELLGLLAYNRAYFAKERKDYKSAYRLVLLAQKFNRDSRSNINFEIGLYYSWGGQLYKDSNFTEAFSVYADGYYRYPENKGLLNNTFSSFFKALKYNWKIKDWPESARLIDEMDDLNVLQEKDHKNIQQILNQWLVYSTAKNDLKTTTEIRQYLKKYN